MYKVMYIHDLYKWALSPDLWPLTLPKTTILFIYRFCHAFKHVYYRPVWVFESQRQKRRESKFKWKPKGSPNVDALIVYPGYGFLSLCLKCSWNMKTSHSSCIMMERDEERKHPDKVIHICPTLSQLSDPSNTTSDGYANTQSSTNILYSRFVWKIKHLILYTSS